MNAIAILVALSATGIEVGWQPLDSGGFEYTIQIEPELADTFVHGDHEIVSSVPSQIDVRQYRIVVGRGKLPRVEAAAGQARVRAAPQTRPAADAAPIEPQLVEEPPSRAQVALPAAGAAPTEDNSLRDLPPPPTADPEPPMEDLPRATVDADPPRDLPSNLRESIARPREPAESPPAPSAEVAPKLLTSRPEDTALATQANRLQTENKRGGAAEPARPWTAFVVALVLLCCSLGANAYLGWIAWEARSRYRQALSRLSGAHPA